MAAKKKARKSKPGGKRKRRTRAEMDRDLAAEAELTTVKHTAAPKKSHPFWWLPT